MRLRPPLLLAAAASLAAAVWTIAMPARHAAAPVSAATAQAAMVTPAAAHAGAQMLADTRDPIDVLEHGGLRGTAPDGAVTLGFGGRLQPDRELRRMFDYYLALRGQLGLGGIRSLLAGHLRRHYADQALEASVLALFDRYDGYLQALAGLPSAAGLAAKFEHLHELRVRMLGTEVATAFFGEEEAADRLGIERLAIAGDGSLDAAEKRRRLQALDMSLPESTRKAQAAMLGGADIQAQTDQLDAEHADAGARYAARAAAWGEQAARNLGQLDAARQQWRDRLADYADRSQRVRADTSLDDRQRQDALDQLLSGFSAPERRRVLALERAGALPGAR